MKTRRKTRALVAENDRPTALVAECEPVLCPSCGTEIAGVTLDVFRTCWECGLTTRFTASAVAS